MEPIHPPRKNSAPHAGEKMLDNHYSPIHSFRKPMKKMSSLADLVNILTSKKEYMSDDEEEGEIQEVIEEEGKDELQVVDIANKSDGNEAPAQKRTLTARLFGKVELGSLRAAVFNLTALGLGIGCQSIPQQFSRMSFISCFISFNLCVLAAFWTLHLMYFASKKEGISEYSALVNKVLGSKMCKLLNIMIIIYMLGSFIAYQINSNYFVK